MNSTDRSAAHGGWLRGLLRGARLRCVRLFRVRDDSERVARGFAIGMIVNFFPTFGFGVLISGFVARMFGGNALAGLVGGATLTFVWPVLFYLNVRLGSLLFRPRVEVHGVEEVTPAAVDAMVWGRVFLTGAIGNSLLVGLTVYVLIRWIHGRFRGRVLGWLRRRRDRDPVRPSA